MPPFTRFYLNTIKFLACPAGFPIVWFLPISLAQFHPQPGLHDFSSPGTLAWFLYLHLCPLVTFLLQLSVFTTQWVQLPFKRVGASINPFVLKHVSKRSWNISLPTINYEVPIFQNIFSEVSFFLHWRVKLISAYFCIHVISRVYKLYGNYPRSISSLSPFHSPLSLPVPLRFQSKPWSDRFMAIHLSVAFYTNNKEYQLGCA